MKILISLAGENNYNVKKEYDLIVAVDGGIYHLMKLNLKPDILIGDGDSNDVSFQGKQVKFPPKKDYTDFELALKFIEKEYGKNNDIDVIGFSSITRIDHLLANLKLLKPNMSFINEHSEIKLLVKGKHKIEYTTEHHYISFFSIKEDTVVTIKDAAYDIEDYKLKCSDVRCISNEFKDDKPINVDVKSGELIFIKSKKD